MKGRESKVPPSADLLVCFPSRAHLSLLPKPICSPSRPPESSTLHHRHHRRPRKGAASRDSPMLWAKNRHNSADISEPSSPKVTCAGQIKVRTAKPSSCKNWQSVMEEIEKLHNDKKNKKRAGWIEALGFKKEVMQFLACLRSIRFDFRCFGAVLSSEITSDEEDDGEDAIIYRENSRASKGDDMDDNQGSRALFSKWFMILQEDDLEKRLIKDEALRDEQPPAAAPPSNALLLMRCRSAPTKSWLEEREEEKEQEAKKTNDFIPEFSAEIGEISRCRSWKR